MCAQRRKVNEQNEQMWRFNGMRFSEMLRIRHFRPIKHHQIATNIIENCGGSRKLRWKKESAVYRTYNTDESRDIWPNTTTN